MSKDKNREEQDLDAEFDSLMEELECHLLVVSFRDKLVGTEWVSRLKAKNMTIEEKQIRNDFLEFLVKSTEKGKITERAFNSIPPPNVPLTNLVRLLPQAMRRRSPVVKGPADDELIKELFDECPPDKAQFLSLHPVPRDGTFTVVIMRNKN